MKNGGRSVVLLGCMALGLAGCASPAPPVIRPFGAQEPIGQYPHTGTDYANPQGTPILAVAEGDIVWAENSGSNSPEGNIIVIQHTRLLATSYEHLETILVTAGGFVKRGEVIALLGNTGYWPHPLPRPPHLHFQVNYRNHPVNPYPSYWYGGKGKPLAFDPSVSYPPNRDLFTHPIAFGPYLSEARKTADAKSRRY